MSSKTSNIKIVRLSHDIELGNFDCNDLDLNEFLLNDAKPYLQNLLAVTYLIFFGKEILAFFSLSNDKISAADTKSTDTFENNFRSRMPEGKQIKSYPAVKIGRMAVNQKFQKNGWGQKTLDFIKGMFIENNKTGCLFITVDAYKQSIGFYKKNGFEFLTEKDEKNNTRQMFFRLLDLSKETITPDGMKNFNFNPKINEEELGTQDLNISIFTKLINTFKYFLKSKKHHI